MKKIKVNYYKINKIADEMKNKYGTIEMKEEHYCLILFTIESNLLKVHRQNSEHKSRKVIESINLFLFIINGYLNDLEYDYSRFSNEGNRLYLNALQMATDPFYNEELKEVVLQNTGISLNDKENLEELFTPIIKCMVRIKQSVELWIKQRGINGYFDFIEEQMGDKIKGDKLNFIIQINRI